jgi:NAD dependent epimerase/dehydratase family
VTLVSVDKDARLLVTGANGRIGRMLRRVWADRPGVLWHARQAGPGVDVVWDIGAGQVPDLPKGLTVLHLAGGGLAYADAARAVCGIGAAQILLMSSAAVYGPGPRAWRESDPVTPQNPYAVAKLAAEMAGPGITVLRLANLAGADALLGGIEPGRPVVLDPIAGQAGGPERSYIGPRVLAFVLSGLIGRTLPPLINLAQPGMVSMADLLAAAGQPWRFGPPRAGAVGRLLVDISLLQSLISLPPATPQSLVSDMRSVPGWPR